MRELRSFLSDSLASFRSPMSDTAQAQMSIPPGTVRKVCETFEDRIVSHHYNPDGVYIRRVAQNLEELIRQNRTYAEQLQAAEQTTLFDLPEHLTTFLRDHDNLFRAAIRNRAAAKRARKQPEMDVLEQITHRLNNIRTAYYINIFHMSGSATERNRLLHDPLFIDEFTSCTTLLQDEILRQTTRLDALLPSAGKDIELENIGPDHNIDDFGAETPIPPSTTHDPSPRCCICLEPYTSSSSSHPPFTLTSCAHTLGKPCLATWLNSSSRNANLCPACRSPLCERRARRPKPMPPAARAEHRAISSRLGRAVGAVEKLGILKGELWGEEVRTQYLRAAMEEVNWRLFQGDVGFCFEGWGGRWTVRRVRWH